MISCSHSRKKADKEHLEGQGLSPSAYCLKRMLLSSSDPDVNNITIKTVLVYAN
jgi:hypothetical protein